MKTRGTLKSRTIRAIRLIHGHAFYARFATIRNNKKRAGHPSDRWHLRLYPSATLRATRRAPMKRDAPVLWLVPLTLCRYCLSNGENARSSAAYMFHAFPIVNVLALSLLKVVERPGNDASSFTYTSVVCVSN